MTSPTSPVARSLALLILIAACLFFIGLGRLPLVEPDEGRNAEVAREMVVTHDWVTPHYDGLPYLDKPAVLFWMIGAAFQAFGMSAWSARFPEALAALAAVLMAWMMGRKMFNGRVGMLAGLILATSPLFFGFARTVIFDMPLTLLVTVSLFCFWLNRRKNCLWLDAVAFAAMGVGAITKGPVAFLLPLLTILAYYAIAGRFRDIKKVHWGAGWLVLLAVALPWFIDVSLRNPGFPKYALWEESLLRFTTGAQMHRSNGPLYYIPVYFAGFFPWSFFFIIAALKRVKGWRKLRDEAHQAELFLLTWAGVVFVFFTISQSKLPGYVLPALPPLSILVGKAWQDAFAGEGRRDGDTNSRLAAGAPGGLAGGFVAVIFTGLLMGASAEALHFVRPTAKILSRIPPSVTHLLPSALFHGAVILVALGALGWRLIRRAPRRTVGWPAFTVAALVVPLLAIALFQPLASYAQVDSSRELAETIQRSAARNLPIYGYYYFRTGLPFYLQRPIGLVTEDGDETTSNYITARFSRFHNRPATSIAQDASATPLLTPGPLIDGLELKPLIGGASFLLMARNNQLAELLGSYAGIEPLWTGWRFSILLVPVSKKTEPALRPQQQEPEPTLKLGRYCSAGLYARHAALKGGATDKHNFQTQYQTSPEK
ncbi:MAG: glycosyltransferase family 39 protein [Terriglobia bacterium]